MSNIGTPVYDFDVLRPVTMTVIMSYNVEELNLPGLFAFLPVTNQSLPANLNVQKKQGKIRLPSGLNCPNEILSMRYNKQVRGIVRSENATSFSHSIIIDLGTSERIISIKLSRTLELTGPTSFEIAREAATALLNHIKQCQRNLNIIQENHEIAVQTKLKFLHMISGGELNYNSLTDIEKTIWEIYQQQTKGYLPDKISDFLDFMLNFNRNLYTGTLEIESMESEMVNIHFNLGFPINQVVFTEIMNHKPFECKFSNAKSASAVNVFYHFTKIDRNTGQSKPAKHTIRINRSGHARHSGPNLEAMKPVYYSFIRRVLQHYDKIQSIENCKQVLQIGGFPAALSYKEWRDLLNKEEEFRQHILNGNVPTASDEDIKILTQTPFDTFPDQTLIYDDYTENNVNIKYESPQRTFLHENHNLPSLMFDYSPLLASK